MKAGDDWNKRAMQVLGTGADKITIEDLLARCVELERAAGGSAKLAQNIAARVLPALQELERSTEALVAYFVARNG